MKIKEFLIVFAIVFVVTLVAATIVTYLYSLIARGMSVFDWEMSFRLAIILGVGLPVAQSVSRVLGAKEKQK